MNSQNNKSEKGQAIVYLMLGLVVFLGFVALAIDGGMALADRRHEQNAADAASLAGGAAAALKLENLSNQTCEYDWSCNNDVVIAARNLAEDLAIDRADANGFSIDKIISDHHGVETYCGPTLDDPSNFIDVTVEISATTPSNFMQLIFPDALHNIVEAVTRVDPGGPFLFGNAIVALNPNNCNSPGIVMGGDGKINVNGGNIFSNGCMRDDGGPTVTITNGVPLYNDPFGLTLENWNPDPQPTTEKILPPAYQIDMPDCANATRKMTGQEFGALLNKDSTYVMDPGLWCLTGDLKITISDDPYDPTDITLIGEGVTIVMLSGGIQIQGTANLQLSAPGVPPGNYPVVDPAERGLLFYLPASSTNPPPANYPKIFLNGNSNALFTGLIYAPSSEITLNGTGGNTYVNSQVVGRDVTVNGTADFYLSYNGCNGYIQPPSIELYR